MAAASVAFETTGCEYRPRSRWHLANATRATAHPNGRSPLSRVEAVWSDATRASSTCLRSARLTKAAGSLRGPPP
jgi:hypothetical protein